MKALCPYFAERRQTTATVSLTYWAFGRFCTVEDNSPGTNAGALTKAGRYYEVR
ncbi:MAG: hypothetical protein ACREBU_02420 [Nitrososphaera sp.]